MTLGKGVNTTPAVSADLPAKSDAITFRLDSTSGLPTYMQLVQQVEHALRLGYLRTGDQLPTVRDVVGSLAINPNTVLKAYRELESRGLAAGRPGQGTFIQGVLAPAGLADMTVLRRSLLTWMTEAADAGLDANAIEALFASSLWDFRDGARGEAVDGGRGAAGRGIA